MFPKANCFRPYFEIHKGNLLNDWLQFQICWCNRLGLTVRFLGYGFSIGLWLYDPVLEMKVEK